MEFTKKYVVLVIGVLLRESISFMIFNLSEVHVLLGLDFLSMSIGLMLVFIILVYVQEFLSSRFDS